MNAAEFAVSGIKEIIWATLPFDSLVIPEKKKNILQALVQETVADQAEIFDDVIEGKGQGLIVLLQYVISPINRAYLLINQPIVDRPVWARLWPPKPSRSTAIGHSTGFFSLRLIFQLPTNYLLGDSWRPRPRCWRAGVFPHPNAWPCRSLESYPTSWWSRRLSRVSRAPASTAQHASFYLLAATGILPRRDDTHYEQGDGVWWCCTEQGPSRDQVWGVGKKGEGRGKILPLRYLSPWEEALTWAYPQIWTTFLKQATGPSKDSNETNITSKQLEELCRRDFNGRQVSLSLTLTSPRPGLLTSRKDQKHRPYGALTGHSQEKASRLRAPNRGYGGQRRIR